MRKINPTSDSDWIVEALRLLSYDPLTGRFFWTVDRVRPCAGKEAGTVRPNGYRTIVVAGRRVRAHRLAFLFMEGHLPSASVDIDHINGHRDDNIWANLRPATRSQNLINSRAKGSSRYRGVSFDSSRNKWLAQAGFAGGVRFIGRFDNEESAARAYDAAARQRFGDFALLNFPEETAHAG